MAKNTFAGFGVGTREDHEDWGDEAEVGEPSVAQQLLAQSDLLCLVRDSDTLPKRLQRVRRWIAQLEDEGVSNIEQARAAIQIAEWLEEKTLEKGSGWYAFALSLGSPVAAVRIADQHLDDLNAQIHDPGRNALLPSMTMSGQADHSRLAGANAETRSAWLRGIKAALEQSESAFTDWRKEEFDAAIECALNWLTLPHAYLTEKWERALHRHRPAAQAELRWLVPLWQRLIHAGAERQFYRNEEQARLRAQLHAALLFLSEASGHAFPLNVEAPTRETTSEQGAGVVVITGKIAPGIDKAESNVLAQYEPLRHPVALTPMPDATRLHAIGAALEREFVWASDAVHAVFHSLLARQRHGVQRLGMHPLLLVGRPGGGKTRFAQRLSELLGTPNTVINMAGMSDVKVLKGVTRGWASNRPSRIVEFIEQTRVANPLFILDEVDKAQRHDHGNGGRPHDALLDLLEPGNAKRYSDIYLMAECDLSHCLFIATANTLSLLPEPLLSRLDPVLFPEPGPEHAPVIIEGIVRDLERDWSVPAGTLTVSQAMVNRLSGLAPRDMRRALMRLWGDLGNDAPYLRH